MEQNKIYHFNPIIIVTIKKETIKMPVRCMEHQHARLKQTPQVVNRHGRLLLNLHLNSYLPLEYNLEMQERGGGTSPTMEQRLHDIIFAHNDLLFFSTCSVRLCTITDMHNKN